MWVLPYPWKKWIKLWTWLFQKANSKSWKKLQGKTLNSMYSAVRSDKNSQPPSFYCPKLSTPDVQGELTVQDELVFKGTQLVIPYCLRRQMMEMVHYAHIGIDRCIRRAWKSMYWPRMSTELREFMSKCNMCLAYRLQQTKEQLEQQQFAARTWNKIGTGLCELNEQTMLVVSDYHNFIKVEKKSPSQHLAVVIKVLKTMFARYGVPDIVVLDNRPQFASTEFARFSRWWNFEQLNLITSISSVHWQGGQRNESSKTFVQEG